MAIAGGLTVATALTLIACEPEAATDEATTKVVKKKPAAPKFDDAGKVVPQSVDAGDEYCEEDDKSPECADDVIYRELDAGAPVTAPPAEAGVCTLPELMAPVVLSPAFMQVDTKNNILAPTVVPTVTVAQLKGTFVVDKATVWLPNALKGLVKPAESTGTVTTSAIFDGVRHRFSIHAKISVASKKGPQLQTIDVDSYGTHTLEQGVIHVSSACDQKPIPTTLVQFIDNGDRVMFLLATKTNRGDVIVALEAPRGR